MNRRILFNLSLALLFISVISVSGYAIYRGFTYASEDAGITGPSNVVTIAACENYVKMKEIPADERTKSEWDLIISFEDGYYHTKELVSYYPEAHHSFRQDMKRRESYINRFPFEEHPTYEELMQLPYRR